MQDDRKSFTGGLTAPGRLKVSWQEQEYWLTPGESLLLGAGAPADIVICEPFVSRAHATLTWPEAGHSAELVDHSTNGTLVQTEDQQVTRLHRGAIALWGCGWLSPVAPLAAATAVRYQHV
ncbi:MAG: FHA domain-containing protein [Pseudomonadales bacterium]|nr:FHA domain-containing protein [Pseudomonadales bacterium]MCP5186032.1 FHA domain-containing protein [Pseudomonadales bacterium]